MSSFASTKDTRVTVVMYHYVRPIARSRFPRIKGLEASLFREQLRYIKSHYTPISMGQMVTSMNGGESLPTRPCLLTFDDGYSDHYNYAFPILMDEGITGAFYPPRSVVLDRKVLEVNKAHFILASVDDMDSLEAELDGEIAAAGYTAEAIANLKAKFRQPNRFDTGQTIYVKRMLQHALPDDVRGVIAERLFARYVTNDEQAFAEELYISPEQARVMLNCGMHFGGHGDLHLWHGQIDRSVQAVEIDGASQMLDLIGVPQQGRTYCYPYGDNNDTTLDLLSERGYAAAFLALPGIADPAQDHRFLLSRLDTNDLPKVANAAPTEWTNKVRSL